VIGCKKIDWQVGGVDVSASCDDPSEIPWNAYFVYSDIEKDEELTFGTLKTKI